MTRNRAVAHFEKLATNNCSGHRVPPTRACGGAVFGWVPDRPLAFRSEPYAGG